MNKSTTSTDRNEGKNTCTLRNVSNAQTCETRKSGLFNIANMIIALFFVITLSASALNIEFTFDPSIPSSELAEVTESAERAAARWESILTDDVTIRILLKKSSSLNFGEAARASVLYIPVNVDALVEAMIADATTDADLSAVANLPVDTLSMLINLTSDNPNGASSETPFFDNEGKNNTSARISLGNAKALGLFSPHADFSDSTISYSTRPNWDFDVTDGIAAGTTDFEATLIHEIGHALGLTTLIEGQLANRPGKTANEYAFVSPQDLFRFSAESIENGLGTIDWTADSRTKFFSIDGGATKLAEFATGIKGDGADPSHWRHNRHNPAGIMDPAVHNYGHLSDIDVTLIDVIGWDLAGFEVATRGPVETEEVVEAAPEQAEVVEAADEVEAPAEEVMVVATEVEQEAAPEVVIEEAVATPVLGTELTITSIAFGADSVTLSWEPVENANGYLVYTCDELTGGFKVNTSGSLNGTTWTKSGASHDGTHCFFQVRAF